MERREFLNHIRLGLLGTAALSLSGIPLQAEDEEELFHSEPIFMPDIYLPKDSLKTFYSVRDKLQQIQNYVGFGHFNIISFDRAVSIARWGKGIKRFTPKELDFMEYIYFSDPTVHGFYGQPTSSNITDIIHKREVKKIPYTGHYLYKAVIPTYDNMKRDIGNTIILTSGVRSIVKQMKLYLDKIYRTKGNLSDASRSIAPPRFSYHTVGDFDIGKKGFGYANFTPRFALTDEFFRMRKLTYIDMRYTIDNKEGVRYEPWHIKIV